MAGTLLPAPSLDAALHHAISRVRTARRDRPLWPVHALLPGDDSVLQWQRRLGDHAGVRAWQFYRLAEWIVDRAAVPVTEISGQAALALVRQLLAQMKAGGELTTFAAVAGYPGFARVALEWLREMRTQEISPEQMEDQARRSGSHRDAQLALLYRRYDDFLQQRHCTDADGLLATAAGLVEQQPGLAGDIGLLLVLGFDQFSPVQLRLLRNLASAIGDVSVYLTWDEDRPSDSRALSRLARTRQALLEFATLSSEPVLEPPGVVQSLRHVRRFLLEPDAHPGAVNLEAGPPVWRAIAAPSREAEVRLALRAIKRLLLDGADPGAVALLAPSPDRYANCVAAVAREYGVLVPVARALAECPPIRALLNLLLLPFDFPRRETFDALRSPYVCQSSLSSEQIALLDRLTRERPVVAGRNQWLRALDPPLSRPEDPEDEDRLYLPLYATLPPEQLQAIREGLIAFFDTTCPPRTATAEGYVIWLQERVLGLRPDGESEEPEPAGGPGVVPLIACPPDGRDCEQEALGQLLRALRDLLDEATLLGTHEDEVEWSEFRRALVERLRATAWQTGGTDGVRFGPLEAGRAVVVDHLFVLGLSEGEFPAPPPPDPLYHSEELQAHPLPLRRPYPEDDACLWWQVLGAVRCSVTLLR
ncbi:MAG: hypothetical protein HPY83_14100, partial [Anaerolineae bacterium]|nr:hypothetical protein [Anaerolineae bacterium]